MDRQCTRRVHATTIAREAQGTTAIAMAICLGATLLAVGAAVDFAQFLNRRDLASQTADAAVLAVAKTFDDRESDTSRDAAADRMLQANGTTLIVRSGPLRLDSGGRELCLDVTSSVPTSFLRLAGLRSLPVALTSCATIANQPEIEISLILDVSSSMIEEDRFAPMQSAVLGFIDSFASDPELAAHSRLALVPFSSRVNMGLTHTDWLTGIGGGLAVPARWTDPAARYGSKYDVVTWTDGVTTGYRKDANIYWLGCIEPRSDVDKHLTGSVPANSLGEAPPSEIPFVAMDANPKSGQSFCPTPIVPLSGDFAGLRTAASQMTSQGSTRLDAGIVAGWYTLSDRWKGLWGDPERPASPGPKTVKAAVFMTDGEMNTQHGQGKSEDWRCTGNMTKSCNKEALADFLTVCSRMKAAGITIYTVSYGEEADRANLRACASSSAQSYVASAGTSGAGSIVEVYKTIAASMKASRLRLSR